MITFQDLKFRPKTPEWFKVFQKLSEIDCDAVSKASMAGFCGR